MPSTTRIVAFACLAPLAALAHLGAQQPLTPYQQSGRDILRELVETNTEHSIGSTTKAAELLAARFRAAGFAANDIEVVSPDTGTDSKDKNLVVRYRGAGKRRPILLIGHLDVVEARRSDWARDPFTLVEENGYFYGRGTLDMKDGDAAWVAALLRMKQEGVVPQGDYLLALTAGEEGGGGYNGIQWLLASHRTLAGVPLDSVQYVLNADAGGGELRNRQPTAFDVQAAEKVFYSVSLTARNPGGHSSLPRKDNAIYALARALARVSAYEFPAKPNDVVKAYFSKAAATVKPQVADDMRAVATGKATPGEISRLSA